MGQSTVVKFGETELSALNARADALSKQDASAWEEAVDWGATDCAPGHWGWRNNKHVWVGGHYIRERRGYHLVSHRREDSDGRWRLRNGNWER